jgi:hypothetical protein
MFAVLSEVVVETTPPQLSRPNMVLFICLEVMSKQNNFTIFYDYFETNNNELFIAVLGLVHLL